jgi:hypothetical protein
MHWHGRINLFSKHGEEVGAKLRILSLSSGRYVKVTKELPAKPFSFYKLVMGIPGNRLRATT